MLHDCRHSVRGSSILLHSYVLQCRERFLGRTPALLRQYAYTPSAGILQLVSLFLHCIHDIADPDSLQSSSRLLLLPLFRRKALRGPRMYRRDLLLQRTINESMSRKRCLLRELRRHYCCLEHLATATYKIALFSKSPSGPVGRYNVAHQRDRRCQRGRLPTSL